MLVALPDILSIFDDDIIDLDFNKVLIRNLKRSIRTQVFPEIILHDSFKSLIVPLVFHYNTFDVILFFRKD